MNIEQAINAYLDGQAILFTGSGFSAGSENISGAEPPIGWELREFLASQCDFDDPSLGLEYIAQEYIDQKSEQNLIDELKKLYQIKNPSQDHNTILKHPWKRIYTTNYDDLAEMAAKNNGYSLTPITMSDDIQSNNKTNICVHINGSINRLNTTTLNNEFKLTDTSYASESLTGKPWFEFMISDFKSAKAIIIVGFSMKHDIDFKRIIAPPYIRDKVLFITESSATKSQRKIFSAYGAYSAIDTSGLAQAISERSKSYVVSTTPKINWNSFTYEYQTPAVAIKPNFTELFNFYYKGTKANNVFYRNHISNEYEYIISPLGSSTIYKKWDSGKRVFLAISSLGNGKSIFCEIMRDELRQKSNTRVFTFSKRTVDMENEVENICNLSASNQVVVIIDNYYSYTDVLAQFQNFGCGRIKFILSGRSSISRVSLPRLTRSLGVKLEEIEPINLNNSVQFDFNKLVDIFKNNNLLSVDMASKQDVEIVNHFTRKCRGQFSSILLDQLQSQHIMDSLSALFDNSDESGQIKEVAVFALTCAVFNIEIGFSDILRLLKYDYIALIKNQSDLLTTLFNLNDDSLNINSSILAREMLLNIIDFGLFIQVITKIVNSADESYKKNRDYEELLKSLVSHSIFNTFPTSVLYG